VESAVRILMDNATPKKAADGGGEVPIWPWSGGEDLWLSNENMLAVAYSEYSKTGNPSIGYLIAGNAGIVGGGLMDKRRAPGAGPRWNIDCGDKRPWKQPQEEGSFINFFCATQDYKTGNKEYFFDRMKAADRAWGMKALNGIDHLTKQGVDYTTGIDSVFKYEKNTNPGRTEKRCIYVGKLSGYSQKGVKESLEEWDESKRFPCKVFITAGPQWRDPDKEFNPPLSSTSTMRRTYDGEANKDYNYLTNSIFRAYVGSLTEMDNQGITVALVPGLSTGVYASPSKKSATDFIVHVPQKWRKGTALKVKAPSGQTVVVRVPRGVKPGSQFPVHIPGILERIPEIIHNAITHVSPKNIKKVIYCHPKNEP